ncbi:MAG: hypothetical protein AUH84_05955 [Thaumarchaeota archaeon 13_1_40CM_4_38_7]|nr:MAG: hypothetical protein AUH84_05955 [Thaumarchaeota archaeon 13_1_40CM_4_38_7]OLC93620.1 MAG: hypothetical protein AUI92_02535 [Thaumarchaeota archaeon 13_1_40CM_3_38_6]OLD28200.1 MAG: hypothetical protein AUI62_04550 [Thaumarchaeota archaeon 13_1_40CM_2_39_7]
MAFAVRIVNHQHNRMLNICDADLVGKTVKKSEFTLNINKSYFAERIVDQSEAEVLLRKSSIINMVGKETIALSVGLGIGSSKGVKEIDGIPFLLVFKF